MAIAMLAWVIAIPLLGGLTGLRTMTPMAILCWFAWRGNLPVDGTWAFWTAKPVTVLVFAVLAAGELIGDKLPMTPNRTAPFPLLARIAFGGLIGALAATGVNGSAPEGIFLGIVSAVAGAFVGFHLRHSLVTKHNFPALGVALVEDALAVGLSILAMESLPDSRSHMEEGSDHPPLTESLMDEGRLRTPRAMASAGKLRYGRGSGFGGSGTEVEFSPGA